MNIVVWEWEGDHNIWTPYSANVTHYFETSAQSGKMNVNLGDVDQSLACYVVNLKMKTQTRFDTGMMRRVRRTLYPSFYPCGQGISWQWYNDVRWVSYDMETAHTIEEQYQKNNKSISIDLEVTRLGIPNCIELSRMVQVNKFTLTERKIQRKVDNSFQYPRDSENSALKSPSNTFKNTSLSLSAHGTIPAASSSRTQSLNNHDASIEKEIQSPHKRKKMTGNDSNDPVLYLYCKASTKHDDLDEECSICFEKLKDISGFYDSSLNAASNVDVRELKKCPHKFHGACLLALIKTSAKEGWLQCPTCKVIQGVKQGTQPKDGTMNISRQGQSLPGHPGCGMITITYNFKSGIQGQEHPHPGKHYHASGFPRLCYLPDNAKGQKVLKLLQKAWKRRLIFTVATSNTTGQDDTIVWNEIHHKTEPFSNISGHGYPDPNYLDNVLTELSIQGVDDE